MVWDKENNDFKIVKSESPEIDKEEELWEEFALRAALDSVQKTIGKKHFTIHRKP